MDRRIRDIVIVGGGTAGWMTASYLGKALEQDVTITVLEAPTIPRIGVGEATVPNLQRAFFDYLGIAEEDWMRECNASFKMAVKFVNWRTPGASSPSPEQLNGRGDHFYHPFGLLPEVDQVPLSQYWFHRREQGLTGEPFDYACYREPPAMDAGLAPKTLGGTPMTRYAWHFDAHLVADFLQRFAIATFGVSHVRDVLTGVELDERGHITGLRTRGGQFVPGDFFIDCSGFRGLLINEAMGEPFLDMSDHLLANSAVATSIPHDARDGVEPYTSAIAMNAGWTWKIPMLGRFGSGYVYSDSFCNQDQATEEFSRLWGLDPETTTFNHIRFRVGRNRRAWVKNCVSVGLSSCFLEPLESTGIYFIYAAIHFLVKNFPDRTFNQVLIDRYNHEIETMFDDTRDFIQAHFYLSPRTDTPFWRANKELRLADGIQDKMARYRVGLPINPPTVAESDYYGNFENEFRNFWTNGSYYCIFAGLGYLPKAPLPLLAHKRQSAKQAEMVFDEVRRQQQGMLNSLPSCVEYLQRLHGK